MFRPPVMPGRSLLDALAGQFRPGGKRPEQLRPLRTMEFPGMGMPRLAAAGTRRGAEVLSRAARPQVNKAAERLIKRPPARTPPPLSRADQALAAALSKKRPRRGGV